MIRLACKNDIPGIKKLLEQVLLVHHIGRPDIFKEKGAKYEDEELEAIILNPDTPIYVYVDDKGEVLGHLFAQIIRRKESPNAYAFNTLYIDDLCVEKNHRGMKIGSQLYQYVKEISKNSDIYNITLHVWECNPEAQKFYAAIGLKVQQYTMEEIL